MYMDKLKRLREQHGLSQTEVSKLLNVSPQVLNMWEKGKTKPPIEYIKKASEIFNVSFDYLFNDDYESITAEDRINQALNEAEISTGEEIFSMDEIEKAIDVIRIFREQEKIFDEKTKENIEENE